MLIASLVGLFMYAGFVVTHGDGAVTVSGARSGSVASLQLAMDAAGAKTDQAVITGWVPTGQLNAAGIVRNALGWTGQQTPAAEARDVKLLSRNGTTYVSVRWAFTRPQDQRWAEAQEKVSRALFQVGDGARVTVQLEGTAAQAELSGLREIANKAVDALDTTGRQPWSEGRSASVAGQSAWLPKSPFGVNVQVAVRQEAGAQGARVWVAWPALQQEY